MIVFIGMETSGVSRRAFQRLGVETYSCDLLPSQDGGEEMAFSDDGLPLGRHLVGDVFATLENMRANDIWPDLAIFHPTCTYLTCSAEWAYADPDYERFPGVGYHQKIKTGTLVGAERRQARELAKADARAIWALPIKRKVTENPVGVLSQLRRPTQTVQPYDYGDDASKRTCLWIDGPLPLLRPTAFVKPRMVCCACKGVSIYDTAFGYGCTHCGAEAGLLRPRWANQTDSGQNRLSPSAERWKLRSNTFPGIAAAMATQLTAEFTLTGPRQLSVAIHERVHQWQPNALRATPEGERLADEAEGEIFRYAGVQQLARN